MQCLGALSISSTIFDFSYCVVLRFHTRLNTSHLILPSLKSRLRIEVIHLVPPVRKPVSNCVFKNKEEMGCARNEVHLESIRIQFRKVGNNRLEEKIPDNLRATMSIKPDWDYEIMPTLYPGAARCNPSEYKDSRAASSRDPAAAQTASHVLTTGTPSFLPICSVASTYCFTCSLDLSIFLGGVWFR
jgi:hypothetical protein